MLIKKPLEPILNQKYLRKDETSDILDTFDAPMINVSAVNPIGQTGDKITLIGKMFDDEIEGRNIDFYNGSTYLGTGKTNKYGVGIFDYTCSGAGKKEITGKWGSLVSTPYPLYDCVFYDDGFTNTTQWVNGSSTMSVTANGLRIDATALSTNWTNKKGTDVSEFDWSGKLCVEFELVETTDDFSQFQTYDGTNLLYGNFSSSWVGTVKFIIDGNKIYPYVNNVAKPVWTGDTLTGNYRIGFRVHSGQHMTFKNFKIYPI